jgi:hypothetical protein
MPSLRDPALDERFDDLAAQLRGARPRADEALRARVRELAAAGVPAAPRRRRRLAPILAFAALVAVAALVALAARYAGGDSDERAAGGGSAAQTAPAVEDAQAWSAQGRERAVAPGALEAQAQPPATVPPSGGRLQLYRAELTVRVGSTRELNDATRHAIRIARGLGGFVVSADLRTPEGRDGVSTLVLRVPTTKAQAAYERLAGLGTLVAQRVRLDDLQAGVNRREETIAELRTRIAALERRAAAGEDVATALAEARAQLRRQQDAVEQTTRRGRLATFRVTLTTAEAATAPRSDGAIERAARRAFGLLEDAVAVSVYPLVLGTPLVVLGLAVLLLERRRRRRRDDRLLEQR